MSYAEVEAIFDLYGRKRDKELVGDKTVNDVRSIAMLNALFPEGKFVHVIRDGRDVHVIRDGRDVCLSVLDWKAPGIACLPPGLRLAPASPCRGAPGRPRQSG